MLPGAMTREERGAFEQQLQELLAELEALEEEFSATGNPVELDQAKVGRLSRMDALQGQQMALEASRRRRQRLGLIRAALRRITEGEFGRCLECDEEIAIRRLGVDPASERCISCEQARD